MVADTRVQPLGVRPDVRLTDEQQRAFQALHEHDLARVRERLLRERTLPAGMVDEAVFELRRYLGMTLVSSESVSMLSRHVDEAWHTCVLYTRLYADLCERVFGAFVHHEPFEPSDLADSDPDAEWLHFETLYTSLYGTLSPLWPPPAKEQDIDALEVKLGDFGRALSTGEQAALARLLALAAAGKAAAAG